MWEREWEVLPLQLWSISAGAQIYIVSLKLKNSIWLHPPHYHKMNAARIFQAADFHKLCWWQISHQKSASNPVAPKTAQLLSVMQMTPSAKQWKQRSTRYRAFPKMTQKFKQHQPQVFLFSSANETLCELLEFLNLYIQRLWRMRQKCFNHVC